MTLFKNTLQGQIKIDLPCGMLYEAEEEDNSDDALDVEDDTPLLANEANPDNGSIDEDIETFLDELQEDMSVFLNVTLLKGHDALQDLFISGTNVGAPAPNIFQFRFPEELSQGRLNGRNGSNACTAICTILGMLCLQHKADTRSPAEMHLQLAAAICGSIESGNTVYDASRSSLPHRFLTVHEAVNLIDDQDLLLVTDEINFFHHSEVRELTLENYLGRYLNSEHHGRSFAIAVCCQRSILFALIEDKILVCIDTHTNPPNGATITWTEDFSSLDEFCSCIRHTNCESQSGYLATVFSDCM